MSEKNNAHNCKVVTQTSMGRAKPFVIGKIKNQYYDWDGFARAIKRLNIRTKEEYEQRFREDPFLPADPENAPYDYFSSWEETFKAIYGKLQSN